MKSPWEKQKILIANRGEIAVRIIRACHELGIRSAVVFSEADAGALWVKMADEAYPLKGIHPREAYLSKEAILSIARQHRMTAIHPGYGFLAENVQFATMCREEGIVFIGPSPEHLASMGDKNRARELMERAGVPLLPGSAPLESWEEALLASQKIQFPVILKATGGGGGRGMRLVQAPEALRDAFLSARGEAELAFGDPRIYVEKYLSSPRHIEVQILGDNHGTILALGERECSLQRRYQKLLEESPSPFVDRDLRQKISEAALKGAEAIGYASAGTVEFLVDEEKHFYFLEMNTRIQVEHPVTEMVTGIDLVKNQITIAFGAPLGLTREDVKVRGWAMECRINCEDPLHDFYPAPGTIESVRFPGGPGVRVESGIEAGYTIPPYYDSLIAKVIAWGNDREEARRRARSALLEFKIQGIPTTIPFHLGILENPHFKNGELSTHFLDTFLKEWRPEAPEEDEKVAALIAALEYEDQAGVYGGGFPRERRLAFATCPGDRSGVTVSGGNLWGVQGRRESLRS